MRNQKSKIILGLAALILLAAALIFLPSFYRQHLAWRVDNLRTQLFYIFNPPGKTAFIPTEQLLLTTSTALPSPDPTVTPLPTDQATSTITPTPPPGTDILANVPYVDQCNRWNYCGPANLAMALQYWGWKGTRDDIAAVVKPGENNPSMDFITRGNSDVNVMPYELVDFVNDHTPFRALFRYGGDIDLLKRLIAAGFPVIAEKGIYEALPPTNAMTWAGHYAFTSGYDDSRSSFIWQDSYPNNCNGDTYKLGHNIAITYDNFQNGWRSFNYVFIVVYPPERESTLYQVLGSWGNADWADQHALDIANQESPSLNGNDLFFALFNKVTSQVALHEYSDAAAAFDYANDYYNTKLLPNDDKPLPYRIMWYQTAPYFAYYWTGRYQDVINLATQNIQAIVQTRALEESYYWRALAEYKLGDTSAAYADLNKAYYYNKNMQAILTVMQQWGVSP